MFSAANLKKTLWRKSVVEEHTFVEKIYRSGTHRKNNHLINWKKTSVLYDGTVHSAWNFRAHFIQVRKNSILSYSYHQCHRHVRVMCNAGNDIKQSGNPGPLWWRGMYITVEQVYIKLHKKQYTILTKFTSSYTNTHKKKQYTILNNRRLY